MTSPTTLRVTHLPLPTPPTYPANTDTTNNTPPPQQHHPSQGPTATTPTSRQQTPRAPKNSGFCVVSPPATRVGFLMPGCYPTVVCRRPAGLRPNVPLTFRNGPACDGFVGACGRTPVPYIGAGQKTFSLSMPSKHYVSSGANGRWSYAS